MPWSLLAGWWETERLTLVFVPTVGGVRASSAAERQHGDRADAFGLLRVLGESGIEPRLLVVDAVALVVPDLAHLDFINLGAALDRAFTAFDQVVVPVGICGCAAH